MWMGCWAFVGPTGSSAARLPKVPSDGSWTIRTLRSSMSPVSSAWRRPMITTTRTSGRVLLFEGPDGPFGLWVERSGRAQDVGGGTLHALPPLLAHLQDLGCVGLLTADDHPWFVVDANTFHQPRRATRSRRHRNPLTDSLELPAADGPSLAGETPSPVLVPCRRRTSPGAGDWCFSPPPKETPSRPRFVLV